MWDVKSVKYKKPVGIYYQWSCIQKLVIDFKVILINSAAAEVRCPGSDPGSAPC